MSSAQDGVARKRKISSRDRPRLVALLRHFHKLGYNLQECGHPLRLNREPADLLKLAPLAGVYFADANEIAEQTKAKKRRAK